MRSELGRPHGAGHIIDQPWLLELAWREVHGDNRRGRQGVLPGARLFACCSYGPAPQRTDQSRLLRQWDEDRR